MHNFGSLNRRKVLKTIGAAVATATVLTGTASARGNNYGNGNGVGDFLNDEAVLKAQPVWDSGVADQTGESNVTVQVGTMTSVDVPEDLIPPDEQVPEEGPFGYSPRAVKISPNTEVTWDWATPTHHSVTSYNASAETSDQHGELFDEHYHPPAEGEPEFPPEYPFNRFSNTFESLGTYLYFCHPHGTPYPVPFGPLGEVPNHVGMRGAVIVTDE